MPANGFKQLSDSSAISKTATYATGATLGDVNAIGNKSYLYIYNAGNSSITTGLGAVVAAGSTTGASCTVSSAAGDIAKGFAVTTIATGMYGYLQNGGIATLTSATIATNNPVVLGANGIVAISSGATGTAIGMTIEACSGNTAAVADLG